MISDSTLGARGITSDHEAIGSSDPVTPAVGFDALTATPSERVRPPAPATRPAVHGTPSTSQELRDATRRITELEDELVRLKLHDELKGDFLRFLSKQLQSPLQMLGASRQLEGPEQGPATAAETFTWLEAGYRRLNEVIERGLAWFSWVAREKSEMGGSTDIVELLALLTPDARGPNDTETPVEVEIIGSLPRVRGRARNLGEVLRVVIDNGVKFGRNRGPVQVTALQEEGAVVITVVDNGPGFPPDRARRLTRPFAEGAAGGDPRTVGLSLAVASAIMHAHGGALDIMSDGPGKGACVRLRFPICFGDGQPATRHPSAMRMSAGNDDPRAPVGTGAPAAGESLIESQLLLYARDLKRIMVRERSRRSEVENAHRQMERFAYDLKQALFAEKLRSKELDEAQRGTVEALLRAARFKDQETAAHIRRLSHYSRFVALHLGLPADEADLIFAAAPMHDIGKIGVPDRILTKPGKLTAEEWAEMKKHPAHGASMLRGSSSELIQLAAEISLTHHERWDGSGYPRRLVGAQTPIAGRIVMLVDVYDALRSARPYKPEFSHEQAMDIIVNGDGRTMPEHFDPQLLDVFKDLQSEFESTFQRFRDPPQHR